MTPEVVLTWATEAHVSELAPQLRPADLAEVLADGFASAQDALLKSLACSDLAVAILFDGKVAALAGVAPLLTSGLLGPCTLGLVWALTGELVNRYPMMFFRQSKVVLELLLIHCGHLVQWIDARYTGALRCAQSLGFTVAAPSPHGEAGLPFCFIGLRVDEPWAQ